ncbi:MAG TPA: phytanoyl-CoA dioxygenase family protein [Acidimicrobiales bacterium]|nr:phytanoyl-CoA dioxygenase family protein [Acidimicrobiales bacterium]
MRVPDATLDEVFHQGFSLLEGFLGPDELKAAQEALWKHFPKPDDYFADPTTPEGARFAGSQFAGVEEFPYRSWDLNRLAVHPDLVDAAERYLETTDLHLYKVELWAKYAGAVNYDQPLHRDYGSHSLVVPRPEPRYQQITTFIYLSDVTDEDGPTVIVPYDAGKDVPYTPLYLAFGELAASEVRCVGPAGSLLVYRTDILHRGSNFTGDGRSRFSILVDFQVRGTTWGGKMAWPKQSPERWAKFIPQCTVRQRDLFGFPRPGDAYWTEETLAGVAQRYPGIDLAPYRSGADAPHPLGLER